MSFDPRRYWEERHATKSGLEGVGYLGLGELNTWMYRVRARVFRRALRPYGPIRGARILDVGSGTGFYVNLGRELGANEIVATDLADVACERLRITFEGRVDVRKLDIGAATEPELAALGRFDFISAMDVLFHIVDDTAYAQALINLARLLSPGGRLIFTDNFIDAAHRKTSSWHVSRTSEEIERMLELAGLELGARAPAFILMNQPVDSDSKLLRATWKVIDRTTRRSRVAGRALGAAIYPLEVALTKLLPFTPSTEIAIAHAKR
jgi:SAM-dependent methyltransferase